MARLRVRELAQAQGFTLTRLHAAVNARMLNVAEPISIPTIRRYWFSTKEGKENGTPLVLADLTLLGTVARVLGVPMGELFNEDELGQINELPLAA